MDNNVKASLYSARAVYFLLYGLSIFTLCYYDNDLRRAVINHSFWDVISLTYAAVLIVGSTVMFLIAGSNCGFLFEYPNADIIQGSDYQTGYFVNGRHVNKQEEIKCT